MLSALLSAYLQYDGNILDNDIFQTSYLFYSIL